MIAPSAAVVDSITCFLKLTPLRDDPKHTKWTRDEFDLIEAVDITNTCYQDTARMAGIPMYAGESTFDFTEDVRRAVEENLLGCRDPKDQLVRRKHNIIMYHLVISMIIDQLSKYPHQDVLLHLPSYMDQVRANILLNDVDPHMDDAIVAREMVNITIRERDNDRKKQKTHRRTTKKIPVDLMEEPANPDD